MFGLDPTLTILLVLCLFVAFGFEFVNGFHDTANAVATVIYTHSLKPQQAVVLSGITNAIGVLLGGIGVAMGIVNLLPIDIFLSANVYDNAAVVLAILLTAISWNLFTWYLGIPCSSSHTLIGAILGVGLAYSMLPGQTFGNGVNWKKAEEIGLSLLISPMVGFLITILLMFVLKQIFKKKHEIFQEPKKDKKPPFWVRLLLIFTCTAVSFAHGKNDGQKGVGLIMLILIAIAPTYFILNNETDLKDFKYNLSTIQQKLPTTVAQPNPTNLQDTLLFDGVLKQGNQILNALNQKNDFDALSVQEKVMVRKNTTQYIKAVKKLDAEKIINLDKDAKKHLDGLTAAYEYSPFWVIVLTSLALGIGTMIGWKRIVITIGEKIGKSHLTYAQGASAEIVAALTINIASTLALPVSTTHVLSSGVAGGMVASDGVQNLQSKTLKSIALAWVLTLPVCITVGGLLFFALRAIM